MTRVRGTKTWPPATRDQLETRVASLEAVVNTLSSMLSRMDSMWARMQILDDNVKTDMRRIHQGVTVELTFVGERLAKLENAIKRRRKVK